MSFEPKMPNAINNPNFSPTKRARRKYWLPILFTFHFSLFISHCGLDVEDPIPPSPPIWVQKSLPEEWPERGIDAHTSGAISVEWESNSEQDIQAYHVYRAKFFHVEDSLGNYEVLSTMEVSDEFNPMFIDNQVEMRTIYFYKLRAEDISGNYSIFSDSLSYSLIPEISGNLMRPNGLNIPLSSDRSLEWQYNIHIEMENYTLTILDLNDQLKYRSIVFPGSYVYYEESWDIPIDVSLDSGQVYKWRIDANANIIDGLEGSGSESIWATFLFLGP
jgi:hypothetical protein